MKHARKGRRLNRRSGFIKELNMTSYNLADRLERNYDVSLSQLVGKNPKNNQIFFGPYSYIEIENNGRTSRYNTKS